MFGVSKFIQENDVRAFLLVVNECSEAHIKWMMQCRDGYVLTVETPFRGDAEKLRAFESDATS